MALETFHHPQILSHILNHFPNRHVFDSLLRLQAYLKTFVSPIPNPAPPPVSLPGLITQKSVDRNYPLLPCRVGSYCLFCVFREKPANLRTKGLQQWLVGIPNLTPSFDFIISDEEITEPDEPLPGTVLPDNNANEGTPSLHQVLPACLRIGTP